MNLQSSWYVFYIYIYTYRYRNRRLAGKLRHLIRRVDVGLAVEQQPHDVEAAACGGHDQGGIPVLCVLVCV